MKLIIDIDDDVYEDIEHNKGEYINTLNWAVRNGTPYEERPQGEWIDLNDGEYKCPVCKSEFIYGLSIDKLIKYFPTCPNCGADMRKGGAE